MGMETQGACGNTRYRETKSDITPPSWRHVFAPYTIQCGLGVGPQEASRAAPVPEAMADPGTQAAIADQGTPWITADQGTRVAMADHGTTRTMADQGTREAMAYQGTSWTMAYQGTPWTMADQGTQEAMAGPPSSLRPQPRPLRPESYYPPKKIPWGK